MAQRWIPSAESAEGGGFRRPVWGAPGAPTSFFYRRRRRRSPGGQEKSRRRRVFREFVIDNIADIMLFVCYKPKHKETNRFLNLIILNYIRNVITLFR